jgi:TolB-like protein
MASIWGELKRRNVVRVALAYVIVGWLILQFADVLVPLLTLPEWVGRLIFLLLLVGFPLAVFFAWAYELTPEGLKKEKEVDRSQSITHITGRKLDFIIIGVMAVAIAYFLVDKFVGVGEEPPTGVAVSEDRKSIAVLPFANRSASEEDAFFVDGLHDDLLTHISKIGSIKTISRTSVMQYRDTNKTIPQIAKELGVATIMEGGVQRAGDTIRINVQLIDAATDEHLWAQTYDRQLTAASIFAIQSEIATAIAKELRATLSLDEQQRLATVPTESLPALEAYFLGKQRMATRVTDDLTEAVDLFQRAIELDPDFALAYVGLADSSHILLMRGGVSSDEMNTKSELAINKALELDDRLGEAYASLGLLKTDIDNESAEAAYKRALELNPSYASAHQWYSMLLGNLGRREEELAHIQIAVELDPLSAVINHNLASTYISLGRFDEAMAQFKRNIAVNPTFPGTYDGIGSLYRRVYGKLDKAVPWYEKVIASDPGNSNGLATLGQLVLDLGDDEQAEYWISRSRELAPDGFSTNVAMHILHIYRGEDDQAADYAQKVLDAIPREWMGRVAAAYLRDRDLRSGR